MRLPMLQFNRLNLHVDDQEPRERGDVRVSGCALSVTRFPWNNATHTSSRVTEIPVAPWDQVHVTVTNCLAGGVAAVHAGC
jgi:hypothetical protein